MSNSVESLVRAFVADLQVVMRQELAAEVTAALEVALRSGPGRRSNGLKSRNATPGKRARRSPEEVAFQAEKVLAVIKNNPGSRSEQIARATGLTTAELVAPLTHLLGQKDIKKAGVARGTTYTARA